VCMIVLCHLPSGKFPSIALVADVLCDVAADADVDVDDEDIVDVGSSIISSTVT